MTNLSPEMRRHIEMTRAQASHNYVPQIIDDTEELVAFLSETNRGVQSTGQVGDLAIGKIKRGPGRPRRMPE